MRKIAAVLLVAGVLGFWGTVPAAARSNPNGDVERGLNEWFGSIGCGLDDAGKSLARVFWEKQDLD